MISLPAPAKGAALLRGFPRQWLQTPQQRRDQLRHRRMNMHRPPNNGIRRIGSHQWQRQDDGEKNAQKSLLMRSHRESLANGD